MKKRSTITIVTIAIVFALLIVGVYCAITLDVGMSSSLTYEADGTFTEISAQIKQGTDLSELQNLAGDSYKMDKSLSQKGVITWSAPSVKLSLGKPVATYEFTIKNVGTEDITCYPAEDITTPTNVTCFEEVAELLRIAPETEKTGRLVFEYTGSDAVITEINPKVNFKMATTKSLEPTDSALFTASSATTLKLNKTPTSSMVPDIRVLVVPDTVSGYTITGTYSTTSYSAAPFYKLSKDVKYVVLPSTLTALNNYAFYSYSGSSGATSGTCGGRFLKAINIPDNCSTFGQRVFYNNQNLNQVDLGQKINQFTYYMFYGCNNLRTIKIPETLTTINSNLYATTTYGINRCFEVAETNTTLSSYKGGLYNKAKSVLYVGPALRKVELIDGVATVYTNAFYNLAKIKEISIPNSVTTINSSAFYGCSFDKVTYSKTGNGYSFLNGTLTLNSSIGTTISSSSATWSYWKPLIITLNIPSNIGATTLSASVFSSATSLKTASIGEGITSINGSAFSGCTNLTTISIPSTITSVLDNAFSNCGKLNYTISGYGKYLGNSSNKYLYLADTTSTSMTSFSLPSTTKVIGYRAFYDCTLLKTIDLSNVTNLCDYAFYNCQALNSITLPTSQSKIPQYSFKDCYALQSITLPSNVKTIETYAFSNCTSLQSINLSNVTVLSNYAFSGCSALKTVTLASGLTNIPQYCFYQCKALQSITLPSTVKTIYTYAFYYCSSLQSIDLSNVTTLSSSAFSSCLGLKSVTLSNSLSTIPDSAFNDCRALEIINFPTSLTSIGSYAFSSCAKLTNLSLSSSVTLGSGAFQYCKFKTISYSTSGTGYSYTNGTLNISQTPGSLSHLNGLIKELIVASGADISSASLWGNDIETISYTYSPYGEPWTYKDGTLSYNGGVTSTTHTSNGTPFYYSSEYSWLLDIIFKIEFPSTMTSIEGYAFTGFTALKELTIPETITSINYDSGPPTFYNLNSLDNIYVDSELFLSDLCDYSSVPTSDSGPHGFLSYLFTESKQHTFYFNARLFTQSQLPSWMTVVETVTPSGKTDSYYKVSY